MSHIQFRADETLARALNDRARFGESPSQTARRMLAFYLALLDHGQKEIAASGFTRKEALAIMDACNGWLVSPETAHLVWAQVEDAVRMERLDQRWGVDGRALVDRVRSLSTAGQFALADLVERFYAASREGRDAVQILETIGFPVREEEA